MVFVGVYVTVTTAVTVGTASFLWIPPTVPPTIIPIAMRVAITPKTIQNTRCGMPHIVIRDVGLFFSSADVLGASDLGVVLLSLLALFAPGKPPFCMLAVFLYATNPTYQDFLCIYLALEAAHLDCRTL